MPNWLWPQTKQDGSKWQVRLGRLLHYATTAWALIAFGGPLVIWITDREWLQEPMLLAFPVYMVGRGVRYLLANE